MSDTSETQRHWASRGIARGACAGVLATVLAAALDAWQASGFGEGLTGGQLAALFVYAVGLIGILVVPMSIFVGLGLAAVFIGRARSASEWFAALADDAESDLQATSIAVGVLVGAAVLLASAGLGHAVFLHDLNNKSLASMFAAIVAAGRLPLAVLAGAVAWRFAPSLLTRLPLERLGVPWQSQLVGFLWVVGALGLGVAAVGFTRYYDPTIWPPVWIAQVALVLLGPWAAWAAFGRNRRVRAVTESRLVAAGLCAAVAVAAWIPFASFETEDPIRVASYEGTQLERRVMTLYMELGDRDDDGFSGVLGGPDCDDSDASISPNAFDVPGNGIDENCLGGDAAVVEREKRSTIPPKLLREIARALLEGAAAGGNAPALVPAPVVDLEGKNVVLLLIDTLRNDHMGYMGYERETTPELDALAERSFVFTHAYAHAPNTPRSVPSLFASRYPSEIAWYKKFRNFSPLRDETLTLFEVLDEHGYVNRALTSHWYFRDNRNIDQGFDVWDNAGSLDIAPSNTDISTPRIMSRFDAHLDALEADEQPWSLFIHWADAHGRYMVHTKALGEPIPDWGRKLEDKYDMEIRFMDAYLGQMLTTLEARGLMDETAIVITSDHGEAFGEHGYHFHGQTIYEEIVRVPLVFYVPGAEGARISTPVELIDVAPTILDAAGFAIPDAFSGRSLVPLMEDPEAPVGFEPKPVYAELLASPSWDEEHRILVEGDWKIVWKMHSGTYELYNLADDPGEQKNLYRRNREKAKEMKQTLVEYIEQRVRGQ